MPLLNPESSWWPEQLNHGERHRPRMGHPNAPQAFACRQPGRRKRPPRPNVADGESGRFKHPTAVVVSGLLWLLVAFCSLMVVFCSWRWFSVVFCGCQWFSVVFCSFLRLSALNRQPDLHSAPPCRRPERGPGGHPGPGSGAGGGGTEASPEHGSEPHPGPESVTWFPSSCFAS